MSAPTATPSMCRMCFARSIPNRLVFPSAQRRGRPFSNVAMMLVVKRNGLGDRMTVHGVPGDVSHLGERVHRRRSRCHGDEPRACRRVECRAGLCPIGSARQAPCPHGAMGLLRCASPRTSPPGRLRPTWSRSALRSNRSGALVLGLLRRRRRRSLCCRSPMRPSPWRYAPGASVVPSPPRTLPRDSRVPKDRRRLSHGFSHVCAGSAGGALRLLCAGKSPKISRKDADLRPNWEFLRLLVIGCWWSRWGAPPHEPTRRSLRNPGPRPDRARRMGRPAPVRSGHRRHHPRRTDRGSPGGRAAHDSPAHRRPWRVLQRRRGLRRRRLPHERPGAGAGAGPVRAVERGRSVGRGRALRVDTRLILPRGGVGVVAHSEVHAPDPPGEASVVPIRQPAASRLRASG